MKLVKPSAKIIEQQPGLEGIYKQIELAGRTCYKSEDKITDYSANKFVVRMIESNHFSMLEHGTVYLIIKWWHIFKFFKYLLNPYSKIRKFKYITTNLRVIKEHNWDNDLKYICEPTEHHERRYTFKVITSIGVTRELNRHRVNSIAEQSTRYCNYSKDKFGNEVTFCIPSWYSRAAVAIIPEHYSRFINALEFAENSYLFLIEQGLQPQHAREVLPLCTATEAVYTAFESDWNHFFDLRYFESTGKVHPNMKELTTIMYKEYEESRS